MSLIAHVLDAGKVIQVTDLARISALLAKGEVFMWVDADDDGPEVSTLLHSHCHIHPLVIEDILTDRHTPKVEDYGDYLYVVMHGVRRDAQSPQDLGTIEIDIVLGSSWVFTHHTMPLRSIEGMVDELKRNPRLLERGPAFIAHGIMDRMTDHYLPVVEQFEEEIDDIQESIITAPTPQLLQRIFGMKRSLQRLRRISTHQRDLLQRLSRHEFSRIPEAALPFFRDVYDHFVRIADLAESYRELVTVSLEIYMSIMANRTNEVMKSLALLSTVMLPLNLLVGVYGMNFEWMPLLHTHNGFWIICIAMIALAALLTWTFKQRKWL